MKTIQLFSIIFSICLFSANCFAQNKSTDKKHQNKIFTNIQPFYTLGNIGYERSLFKGVSLSAEVAAFNLNKNNNLVSIEVVERFTIVDLFAEAIVGANTRDPQKNYPGTRTQEFNQKGYKFAASAKFYLLDLFLNERNYNPNGIAIDFLIEPKFSFVSYHTDLEITEEDLFWEDFLMYKRTTTTIEQTKFDARSYSVGFGAIARFKEKISLEASTEFGQLSGHNHIDAQDPFNVIKFRNSNSIFAFNLKLGLMF